MHLRSSARVLSAERSSSALKRRYPPAPGSNFSAGLTVTFGGAAATQVTVESSSVATAKTPAHAAGTVAVGVQNADGQSDTLASAFTYETPAPAFSVTGVSPSSGPTVGGTVITLSGTGFVSGATVKLGTVAATEVNVASATSITAKTPANPAAAADVIVTNPGGASATFDRGFRYDASPAPVVSGVTPATGALAGGTAVTISGTGFAPGARVTFGGLEATSVVVASATSISAVSPASAAGDVNVAVINPDGQTSTLARGFTYSDGTTEPPPSGGCGGCATGGGELWLAALAVAGLVGRRRRRS